MSVDALVEFGLKPNAGNKLRLELENEFLNPVRTVDHRPQLASTKLHSPSNIGRITPFEFTVDYLDRDAMPVVGNRPALVVTLEKQQIDAALRIATFAKPAIVVALATRGWPSGIGRWYRHARIGRYRGIQRLVGRRVLPR